MPEEIHNINGYLSEVPINFNNPKLRNNSSFDSLSSSPPSDSSPIFNSNSEEFSFCYEKITETANYLLERTKYRPKIAIICGSGLGHLADTLIDPESFPYNEIPNFPESTVDGHAGKMVFGFLNGIQVMCMQGRFHYYEGYPLSLCSMPVRVMKMVGCTHLIATNAAGGLNEKFNVGDLMIIKDHINIMGFAGNSPLQGPNDNRFGPRFPSMNKAYDPELVSTAVKLAKDMGMENETHTGVYTCLGGPSYETVAELNMWKILGVDAIGMSTVHEVITARHCNMKAFAFSLITNKCVTQYDTLEEANHEEVVSTGAKRQTVLSKYIARFVETISETL